MFKKILIANRGEIAVRIIRSCREMDIQTVAVYSDADRSSLHVRYADEAYHLGPPKASESYLLSDKILEIAQHCGADAIHPGYGFLAERADFSQACYDQGISFIGPKPSSIAAMGDKQVARSTVAKAGVPVVPGTEGQGDLSDEALLKIAPEIGFPLLIKPSAGGGGKGMREVLNLEEMPGLLTASRREAKSSFGDGNIYLEKLIQGARHIEIQILADQHGNVIHLGERECSIQRRHQKLLEEAPSPFIGDDQEMRDKMGAVAVQAARAVDYINAGTIEFLVDEDKNYYFLEMNTRLQVEHPVTEAVTGIDIVKEQIRIAAGKPLSFKQEDITMVGWAMECRINAEDPFRGFLPSTGMITQSLLPAGPGIRVDSGVYSGFEVSPYYDALITKLIVHEETRGETITRMKRALEECRVLGVRTNIPFHQALLENPDFLAGKFNTQFVQDGVPPFSVIQKDQVLPEVAALAAVLAAHDQTQRSANIIQRAKRDTSNWKWVSRWERTNK
ncbi:MAG: acetyl-CoA carboxylase biotin carboxylase subunit [Anaerolineales bacterium]|nr:MAG: acetyl-CoA carboxylase biotin carboxylase subunit [Anaerolineales bacterium]